jgi:hypothetical protein
VKAEQYNLVILTSRRDSHIFLGETTGSGSQAAIFPMSSEYGPCSRAVSGN